MCTSLPKIECIDLFCGIGGLTHGLEKVGIDVLYGVDFDLSCKFAYEANNKSRFIHADIGAYNGFDLLGKYQHDSIKILVGCAPCQPFSKLQKGLIDKSKDSKWGLLYSFVNHIKIVDPHIISMENVPELIHEDVFKDFIMELKSLDYFVTFSIVDASDYGVPQRRKRLILLGSKFNTISIKEPTHHDKKVTVRDAIGSLSRIENGSSDLMDPIHRSSKLSEVNLERIKYSKANGTWREWPEDLLPACYLRDSGKSYSSVYGRMSWDSVSPTLTTQFNNFGTGRYGHPEQNRAISVREGAILQSFPKNYVFAENEIFSIKLVTRHIGNAVPVKLGEVIGESIISHIQSHSMEVSNFD